eukprot:719636_1
MYSSMRELFPFDTDPIPDSVEAICGPESENFQIPHECVENECSGENPAYEACDEPFCSGEDCPEGFEGYATIECLEHDGIWEYSGCTKQCRIDDHDGLSDRNFAISSPWVSPGNYSLTCKSGYDLGTPGLDAIQLKCQTINETHAEFS